MRFEHVASRRDLRVFRPQSDCSLLLQTELIVVIWPIYVKNMKFFWSVCEYFDI